MNHLFSHSTPIQTQRAIIGKIIRNPCYTLKGQNVQPHTLFIRPVCVVYLYIQFVVQL